MDNKKEKVDVGHDSKVTHVSDKEFNSSVLESKIPVLADFWAPWCGPCRMLGPILENLAKEMSGKIKVVKINVDDCPEIATKMKVQAIPMLSLFKNGKSIGVITGVRPKQEIVDFIESTIA
ncbi:thioredoxin [bacterium]|nr:thioredoxin [bacterium]